MTPFSLELPAAVDIREVGLRDGLQIEKPLEWEPKVAMIEALAATGARRIEATAFVSPRAVPAMADAERVAGELRRWPGICWSALVASPNGARRAVAAGLTDIEFVVSAVDGHSLANVGRTSDEALAQVAEVADIAHQVGGRCEVVIAVSWDCPFDGRTPQARTVQVARSAVDLGADRLCLGDTIGTTTPRRVTELVAGVRAATPGVELGVHFHDTRGTGQANALAAVLAGVTQLDASIGGLGGCPFAPGASGNVATEELLYWLSESGVETGLSLPAVLEAAAIAEKAVGHALPSSLYRAGGPARPLGRSAARS